MRPTVSYPSLPLEVVDFLFFHLSHSGSWKGWIQPQLPWGKRRVTPWTGRQSVKGLTQRQATIHSLFKLLADILCFFCQKTSPSCSCFTASQQKIYSCKNLVAPAVVEMFWFQVALLPEGPIFEFSIITKCLKKVWSHLFKS